VVTDNVHRDSLVSDELEKRGWRVAIVWECATRDTVVFDQEVDDLDLWARSCSHTRFESGYKKPNGKPGQIYLAAHKNLHKPPS